MAKPKEFIQTLLKMSGLGVQSETQNMPSHVLSNNALPRKYNNTEYQILASRHHIKPVSHTRPQTTDLTQIISYLKPSHEHAVSLVQDVERLRALAPEIVQAENIIVSSIMSPNDLQDADPTITLNKVEGLTESAKSDIIEILTEFFVDEHHLGLKMAKWAGEALFRSGSAVNMILPESALAQLIGHNNVEAGKESLYINEDTYLVKLKEKIHSAKETVAMESKLIKYDRNKKDKNIDKKESTIPEEVLTGIETYLTAEFPIDSKVLKENRPALENITARITTELESGDTLFLSENPEVLRFGSMVRQYGKKKLGKNFIDNYTSEKEKERRLRNSQEIEENIIDLTPYVDDSYINKSHPFIVELPSESVIPICVPGSKTEKLGYFVLIDAFGQPIEASKYLSTMMGCSTSGRIQASYAAMFGNKPTTSGVKTSMFGNINKIGNPWDLQQNAISRVFDYVLDEMLRKKLKNVGLGDVDLGKYNSIATCMLYRLLEKKRTTLVFVPEEILTYIAFDYREDGAGKSKLEDAQFILSLRVTFLVANIMAMMRNAVARKEVEISFDEKETQFESVVDEVRQALNEKYRFSLSSDPTAIAQSINNQNTTIRIASHPNAPGFNVRSTDTQSQVPKADNELLDTLNSWFVTVLGVPHSVLNQLNEAEFSRSVATTNLFFSKMIRTYQFVLCEHVSKYIQTVVRFSPTLQNKIIQVIKGLTKEAADSVHETETSDVIPNTTGNSPESNIKLNKDRIRLILKDIISNIEVGLPAPNIAPDKAQYEIFKDYLSLIDDLINGLFPDQLVGDDSDLSNTLGTIKAFFKSSVTKQFTSMTGLNGAFELPTMEEFLLDNGNELKVILRSIRNYQMGLAKDKVAQTTESTPEEGKDTSSSDTPSDSGSDDYGYNF